MNQFLKYALKYAELGWKILPIKPGQKVPLSAHGVKDATSDAVQIREWWGNWPNANIAVACGKGSGVYAIDVDVDKEKGIDGYESLKEFPPLPDTVCQDTPRGGIHALFRTDNSPKNSANFRPGISVRCKGWYIVLSPSIHPNGKQYIWPSGKSPWEIALAEYPDFMRPTSKVPSVPSIAEVDARRYVTGLVSRPSRSSILERASLYLAECDPAIQGQSGHDKLLWAAVAMVHGFLLSDGQALDLLTREYNPRCIPPWDLGIPKDEKDFQRKVAEARKLTPQKPRGWLLNDEIYAPADLSRVDTSQMIANAEKKALDETKDTPSSPDEEIQLPDEELQFLVHPTGLLGEICDWINATALRRQPFLTLACTLTFLGVLFGRKIRDSLGSRTNLYCMGVAPSSAGKHHAPTQIRKICLAVGCTDLLGGDDIASDVAIESRLSRVPATLFLWDEIGFLLSHVQSGASPHHAKVISLLMKLYSAAGSVFKGREYADEENQRIVCEPCCGIYGTSTIERFAEGITLEELQDGWLSRCLVFRAYKDFSKNRDTSDIPIPQAIQDQVGAWFSRQVDVGNGQSPSLSDFAIYRSGSNKAILQAPKQIVIPRTEEAEQIFRNFDVESTESGRGDRQFACLWAKVEENARRIALILAASESFDSPRITESIANYSCRLVRYLLVSFSRDIVPEITTCTIDAHKQKLLKIIDGAGIGGCLARIITRAARWSTKKQREPLLADLIEGEEVVVQMKEGRKGVFYWTEENYQKYLAQQTDEHSNGT